MEDREEGAIQAWSELQKAPAQAPSQFSHSPALSVTGCLLSLFVWGGGATPFPNTHTEA